MQLPVGVWDRPEGAGASPPAGADWGRREGKSVPCPGTGPAVRAALRRAAASVPPSGAPLRKFCSVSTRRLGGTGLGPPNSHPLSRHARRVVQMAPGAGDHGVVLGHQDASETDGSAPSIGALIFFRPKSVFSASVTG